MTPNKEDYLKCIYEILSQKEKITNKRVAASMRVSEPASSEMIKKLIQKKMIIKHPLTGYELTEAGLLRVSHLIRTHRLLEVFLTNYLNYSVKEVHDEAEIMEHAVSDLFVDRLEVLLDFPKTCPHGSVIPRKGEILVDQTIPLNRTSVGKIYRVSRLSHNEQLVAFLEEKRIGRGSHLLVKEQNAFAQLITVINQDNGDEVTLSDHISANVYVEII